MFKFKQYLIMLTAVNLLLSACAGSVPTTEAKTVVITPAIKGNSASMNVGDTLEIQIPTIPTEGFEWVAQDLDKNVLVQEGRRGVHRGSQPECGWRDCGACIQSGWSRTDKPQPEVCQLSLFSIF